MMEVMVAVQVAGAAFKGIKGALEQGREVTETIGYFAKFFEAKDAIIDHNIDNESGAGVMKLLKGGSVEAEALRITQAKHQVAMMEKELREYLIYTGQTQFYEDMMQERRNIRAARTKAKIHAARRKAFWIDCAALIAGMAVAVVVIVFTVTLIASAR